MTTILGITAIAAVLRIVLVMSSLSDLRRSNKDALIEHARTTAAAFANKVPDAVIPADLATRSTFLSITNVAGDFAILVRSARSAPSQSTFLHQNDLRR